MNINRKVDLSVYYWLKAHLDSSVVVVDGYPLDEHGVPTGELVLPSVASERIPVDMVPFQLGGDRLAYYTYFLNVYAKTKTQRDDMVFVLLDALENSIPVYDYDMGFPPTVSPTQLGALVPVGEVGSQNVFVFPEGSQIMYWRSIIDFRGYYTP